MALGRLYFRILPRALVIASVCAVLATGCGLFKRSDATGAFSAQLKLLNLQQGPTSSNLARSSGEVTFMRLSKLFPSAVQGATPLMKPDDFMILSSTGLNRGIAVIKRS